MAAIFIRAGIPVRRTTAARMYYGLDGWTHEEEILFTESDACQIVIMTTQEKRPHGHTGLFMEKSYLGFRQKMAHASSKKGFIAVLVWSSLKDPFFPNIDLIFSVKGVSNE